MKNIIIADTTLCREGSTFSFKEKIEIARQLQRLDVDVIEIPEIVNTRADILFVRTVSAFVKDAILSVAAGMTAESIENAAASLSAAAHPRIRIELPLSPVGMEYICHKKAPKMIEWVGKAVALAREKCADVEFCAVDATRAEAEVLRAAVDAATAAGATTVSLCDSAAEMLPNDLASFVSSIAAGISVPVLVRCENHNGMAAAGAIEAVREGAAGVKTSVGGAVVPLEAFATMVKNCGARYGFSSGVRYTELHRTLTQIGWVIGSEKAEKNVSLPGEKTEFRLDKNDTAEAVSKAVCLLGYDLSEEDEAKVYAEFQNVAAKRDVDARELEAIVASVALQVPSTYTLESYVINNSNVMPSTAQLSLRKDGELLRGISMGDGPIDAAFLALEQILGRHYELDDFQIQSVTRGKEAMGSALVKLRSEGKLYSGNGISTDIIGASIRAYLNAVNKIVYEEA